ncbi:MAG: hypothetical protein Q7S56_00835 [Nanoarchaeota archaeon]|nr:hypothetical protein [Nanoarchaeota archaeon]
MEYTPKDIAEIAIAHGNLEVALRDFRRKIDEETQKNLLTAIREYEIKVPDVIRIQTAFLREDHEDLIYLAQLKLDRFYDSCSAHK